MTNEERIISELGQIKGTLGSIEGKIVHMDKRLGGVEAHLSGVDKRLAGLEDREGLIFSKVMDIEEKMVTRDDFNEFKEAVATQFDYHSAILERLDQERLMGYERSNRIEGDIRDIRAQLPRA